MRLLLMCASEVSEGVQVMEGGTGKSETEEVRRGGGVGGGGGGTNKDRIL